MMNASELRQANYQPDPNKYNRKFEGKMLIQSFNICIKNGEKRDIFLDKFINNNTVISSKGDENFISEFSLFQNEKQKENAIKLDKDEKICYKAKYIINLGKPKKSKKEKKLLKKKKNVIIDSEGWHLFFDNLVADKNNIIQVFKENNYLPLISEYIVADNKKDTHVFLLFRSSYTYNEKIHPDIFNYKEIMPQISECKYWTENQALMNLCKDPNNYITNIDRKRMETTRENLLFLDYDIVTLAKMGKISLH